jgi:hypothetical protein
MANKKNNEPKKTKKVTKVTYTKKTKVNDLRYKVLVDSRVCKNHEGAEITYPALCVTNEYGLLEMHIKNRVTTTAHNKKMYLSVELLRYVLRPIVVALVNGKYYIIDGQHLYRALVSMNLPVEFYLIEAESETEALKVMKQMNSSARRWGLSQFVKVNTNDKKANAYNKLLKFVTDYCDSVGMTIKVMSAIMYSEATFNENASAKAINGDYFVQNVPDVRIKKRLDSLKRFYRITKMTPTNYLNAGFMQLVYDKRDTFYENEKQFFQFVKVYAHKHNLTCFKFGNRQDALNMLVACWKQVVKS